MTAPRTSPGTAEATETVARSDTAAGDLPQAPHRFRAWLAADPRRKVALAAAILVAGQTVLRGWVAYRGYFALDDFAFTARAARYSLTDLHEYLLKPYNSHLMPGAFAEVWVLTKLWPLNFGAVVTVNLVLQILVDLVFYRVLRELFGTRPVILVPYTVFLFTPITLPAFVWWAAALNQLPQQLAMITALWCHTRYLRTGRARVGVYGAVATLAGLAFSEKTLLTVPLVIAYTVLFFADGNILRRIAVVSRAHWRVWLAYLAVAVPYAAYYAAEVPLPGRTPPHGGDVVQLFGSAFAHALDPGFLGGPWSWQPLGFVGALTDPGRLATYAAGAVVIGFVACTIAWWRNAVYGWLLAIGYATVALLMLALSRATFIGPLIGDEYRYVTDVAAVGVIGATLAVLRPTGRQWQTVPEPIERRAWTRRLAAHRIWDDVRAAVPRPRPAVAILALIMAFLVSATVSTVHYDRHWSSNPARSYLTTLRRDLALAPRDVVLYDQPVPSQVIAWALLYPYNRLSNVLAPLPHRPRFLEPGHSAANLALVDDLGHLRRAAISGPHSVPGPLHNWCGWLLGPAQVRIPLERKTLSWTWLLQMGYIASADTTGTIHAGRTTVSVRFRRGLNELYLPVIGSVADVTFSALPRGATVCTADIAIGNPVAIDGSKP